ncbi:MAG TPA: gas vesicle protein GvpG [Segeticoccus sp.]|uniref:gas vesicle protein GvpG n=1 Tax=Segeticoccus sp. TaxID=2706531 RepID=UPI002D809FC6|nr:gas vesicle protein GvpG [Segeticoccus sp.]HET8599720.1 gas vesicle protein GvpG [Segeticoccus sp.]
MGLFTGLLTLPVAPIRGVIAIAELLQREAEARLNSPAAIRQELEEVAELRERGLIDEEEAAEREDLLIRRLIEARATRSREE